MSKWNLLLFGIYPYVALAICLIGSWARFDLSQYTWKAGSSQMLNQANRQGEQLLPHRCVVRAGRTLCRPADTRVDLSPRDQH